MTVSSCGAELWVLLFVWNGTVEHWRKEAEQAHKEADQAHKEAEQAQMQLKLRGPICGPYELNEQNGFMNFMISLTFDF